MRKTLVGIGALVLAPIVLSGCGLAPTAAGPAPQAAAPVQAAPIQPAPHAAPAAERQKLLGYELMTLCPTPTR